MNGYLVSFLIQVLGAFVQVRSLGQLIPAPFQMKTGPELPGREPDLIVLRRERLDRLRQNHLEGPADLVVEVVTPDRRLRDRGEKFAEYELGGVQEYWILDPELRRADFYLLGEDGRYELRRPSGGAYESIVLEGLRLPVEWFWTQPPLLECLEALGLLA